MLQEQQRKSRKWLMKSEVKEDRRRWQMKMTSQPKRRWRWYTKKIVLLQLPIRTICSSTPKGKKLKGKKKNAGGIWKEWNQRTTVKKKIENLQPCYWTPKMKNIRCCERELADISNHWWKPVSKKKLEFVAVKPKIYPIMMNWRSDLWSLCDLL